MLIRFLFVVAGALPSAVGFDDVVLPSPLRHAGRPESIPRSVGRDGAYLAEAFAALRADDEASGHRNQSRGAEDVPPGMPVDYFSPETRLSSRALRPATDNSTLWRALRAKLARAARGGPLHVVVLGDSSTEVPKKARSKFRARARSSFRVTHRTPLNPPRPSPFLTSHRTTTAPARTATMAPATTAPATTARGARASAASGRGA